MWKIVISVLFTVSVLDNVSARGLPSYIKICKRRGADLRQCLAENVELIRPRLKKGVPELFIPPMDPLVIPEASLDSGDRFKASFKNTQLYHIDNFKIEDFTFDLDKYHVDIKITFPYLRIKSQYNLKGRLLVLQLNGQGPADGNYTNVHSSLSLKGTPYKKNNKEYVKWEKENIDIKVEKIHLQFDRIFGDNEELNVQTNKVINENIESIVGELQPVVQSIATEFIFSIVNRMFGKYSINELFIN